MGPFLACLHPRASATCAAILASSVTLVAQSERCAPDWIPTFGGEPGANGHVRALAVLDDGSGSGPGLYAGGWFSGVGGLGVGHVARWDGHAWTALGSGVSAGIGIDDLDVFDDGSGPALYACGSFTKAGGQSAKHVARWDGQDWSSLGAGTNTDVHALTVFDDGSGGGPALYAGGAFDFVDGQIASKIAKWDGQTWSALGSGVGVSFFDNVQALVVFDDGSGAGPALYAGGTFTTAGGQNANNVAKWDGQAWSPLGSGAGSQPFDAVHALAVFDDGSGAGPALYAGGSFTSAGGVGASNIARWDGQGWSALGSGTSGSVRSLTVFDDGSGAGPSLWAGGYFTSAGGQGASHIARWSGQGWGSVGSGMDDFVETLTVFDDGSVAGDRLYAGGGFMLAGGEAANHIASSNGQGWSALGSGLNATVRAVAAFDDGSGAGPVLHAGGDFITADGAEANRIARWDGQSWGALSTGLNGTVHALTVFDDGSGAGPALHAGGLFTSAGGQIAPRIAKWDGQGWSAVGSGMNAAVRALAVFDDGMGAGPALYAAGDFTSAGNQAANRIARWDGQSWSALDSGLNAPVHALVVFDDGSGPALYAGGVFTFAGNVATNHIARWDGQAWSALASGCSAPVRALAAYEGGSGAGPALYAGGLFFVAGTTPVNGIARWDGQAWSALASGLGPEVHALAVFDEGSGAGHVLYAGGSFLPTSGVGYFAGWDGQGWKTLGGGVDAAVSVLSVFDDGSGQGPALYVGGEFEVSPGGDSFLARWDCPAIGTLPGCFGNPAALSAVASEASIGSPLALSLSASQITSGLGLLYFGADGTDAAGCGLLVAGLGEVLLGLAPGPKPLGSVPLGAGTGGFVVPVPAVSSLVGVQVALQGFALGLFDPGVPIEVSNALLVTITLG